MTFPVSVLAGTSRRRHWLVAASCALLLRPGLAAGMQALPGSVSLFDELRAALRHSRPLVVMVSLEGCVFCRHVRQHLVPLGEQGGVSVVQVDMRSQRLTRDFGGRPVSHDDRVREWNVKVAPTVLFIGRGGAEIAERLAGYSDDFYGFYLAERLAGAQARLRA
jgi:thioredoxin-related protein